MEHFEGGLLGGELAAVAGHFAQPGSDWTDEGCQRERRQLKHRAEGDTRIVPTHPGLTEILRDHLAQFATAPDGHLFSGVRGGELPAITYRRGSKLARRLSRRRSKSLPWHAALSLWLNATGAPAEIATRGGDCMRVLQHVHTCAAGGCSWPAGFVEADAERSVRMVRARSGSWGTALLTGESRLGAGTGELAQRELDHGQQRLRRVGAKPAPHGDPCRRGDRSGENLRPHIGSGIGAGPLGDRRGERLLHLGVVSLAGRSSSDAPMCRARSAAIAQIASYLLAK